MRGMKTIKLLNGQDERRAHWLNLLVETVNRQLTTEKLRLLFRTGKHPAVRCLGILVVWMGALRVLENTFSVGMLLAFIAYKNQFIDRISELDQQGRRSAHAAAACRAAGGHRAHAAGTA